MTEDRMPETPDERIKLIADYTKNDVADIKRFIGAAEACGFTFMRQTTFDKALDILEGVVHEQPGAFNEARTFLSTHRPLTDRGNQ